MAAPLLRAAPLLLCWAPPLALLRLFFAQLAPGPAGLLHILLLLLLRGAGCCVSHGLIACSSGCHSSGVRPGLHPPASSTRSLACGYAATASLMQAARRGVEASVHRLCGTLMLWQKAVPKRCLHCLQTHRHASRSSILSSRGREACNKGGNEARPQTEIRQECHCHLSTHVSTC